MKTFVVEMSYISFVTDKDLCGWNVLRLLSYYVFARESISPIICSIAMSLYDIIECGTVYVCVCVS